MAVTPWIQEQVNAAEALIGAIVLRWNAVEMAIRETGPTGDAAFTDPSVPCLQLFSLTLDLVGDVRARIGIYQNDVVFGLSVSRDEPALVQQGVWDGIYRQRMLDELPTGRVDRVRPFLADVSGDLAEIEITVAGSPVLLIAGEIEETWTDGLKWLWLDESILVFKPPELADKIEWAMKRSVRPATTPC
jgi:hypothetical protein